MSGTSVPKAGVLVVVLVAVACAALWLRRAHEPAPTAPAQPTLVLLPLHAAGNATPGSALLAEGLSRDLTARLARIHGLRMIAPVSAARAQAEKFDLDQLTQHLHATCVLEGSLREADDQLMLELRLSALPDGRTRWAQAYTRRHSEAGALEQDVALAVAAALGRKGEANAAAPEIDPALQQEYFGARHLVDERDQARAIEQLRALLAKTPDFAAAHGLLARTLAMNVRYGATGDTDVDETSREATRALELDDAQTDAYYARAVLACHAMDWGACMDGFRRAAALDPSDIDARLSRVHWLAGIGYVDAALREVESVAALDPLSYDVNFARARLLDTLGRHDEARQFLDVATPPSSGLVYARWHNAIWRKDLAAAHDYAAAIPQSDGFRESYIGITEAFADPSRWPQIQPLIGTSERATGRLNVLRALLPNPDSRVALEGIERMLRNGWPSYYLVLWMPEYRALRAEPAFGEFVARTHIIDYWRSNGFPPQCKPDGNSARCD